MQFGIMVKYKRRKYSQHTAEFAIITIVYSFVARNFKSNVQGFQQSG